MYPYVTMTIVCGTSHKYTNIHNFYSVNYYKYFTSQYYTSQTIHVHSKSNVRVGTFVRLPCDS